MDKIKKTNLGYRLHKNRVLFSGGEIIRTIKYPLVPYDNNNRQQQEFYEKFKKEVIKDDLTIRGDLNLNDYLSYTDSNQPVYTLFDYWIDSLRAGVIWVSKTAEIHHLIFRLYPDVPSVVNKVWENTDERIKKYFNKELFIEKIILSDPLRNSTTRDSFKNRLISYLKEEFKKKEDKEIKVNSAEAEILIDNILNNFFIKENGAIKNEKQKYKLVSGKEQDNFWKNEYGIDKSIIEENKPKGDVENITFLIVPELISLNDHSTVDELLLKRKEWLEKRLDKKEMLKKIIDEKEIDSWLKKILGLENNFNGFSNYFGVMLEILQKGKDNGYINKVFEGMVTFLPVLKEKNKNEVYKALAFLSEKALKLEKPSLPMISSWAEYRSVFGGKLESWFSNLTKRKNELSQQIKKFQESLEKAEKFIDEKVKSNTEQIISQSEVDNLRMLLSRLKKFNNEKTIDKETQYEVFSSLLSSFKKQLNYFYQVFNDKKNEEKNVANDEQLTGIFQKIYKPVAFFGVSSKKRSKKIIEKTIPTIEEGIDFIFKILSKTLADFKPETTFYKYKNKNDTEEDNYRKLLQLLLRKIQDSGLNSLLFKKKYSEIIKNEIDDEKLWQSLYKEKNKKRYVFYKSPYSRGSLTQIKIKDQNWLDAYRVLVLHLKNFILQFDKQKLLSDEKLLIDWIELGKSVFSHLLRFNEKEAFSLTDFKFENFETIKNYADLFSIDNLSKNELSFIVQDLIFSELKGAATLFSKKSYIAKYTVQVIGSNRKFLLFYKPKDSQINLKEIDLNKNNKTLMRPHHYLILLDKESDKVKKSKNKDPNLLQIDKTSINKVFMETNNVDFLFRLFSSPYQLQFLDKFIYRPQGWENIDITLSEWSFIVEQEYEIKWLVDHKKPQFILKTNSKKNKLYLSLPFHIKAKDKNLQLKNVVENRTDYPILGVDVGEYGLAYCLVFLTGEKINALKTGFIADSNIANIKDKFLLIQQKSRQGIFNEKDSSVSHVRENAIGHLRNQLHHVVLGDDKGASVVYEYQISNFETGSNKTTKIYDSVKRADVKTDTDADRQIHNHVWGKSTKLIGRHLSAYASSYTCAKCHRSLYQVEKDDLDHATIESIGGNILMIKTKKGNFYGYSENKKYHDEKYKNGEGLKNTKEGLKEFKKLVQDFARPPVSTNSEVLNKFYSSLFEDKESFEKFRRQRGNSAIFICPFVDCNYLADADIQAAFMMALRGYLNFKGIVKSKEKKENYENKDRKDSQSKDHSTGQSYLKESIKLLNDSNFDPDNLFYPFPFSR